MLRYGAIAIDPPLVLAPMAGITDRQFRLDPPADRRRRPRHDGVHLVGGAGPQEQARAALMHYVEEERPISIQIYGRDAGHMAEAARIVEEIGADICDINMGCPANKILKGCSGCALMGDLDLARDISARRCARAISIPLSVKFRLGLDDDRRNYLELGRICEGEGVDVVAMHARTARQMFRGRADWSEISRPRRRRSRSPSSGTATSSWPRTPCACCAETGCDGVMIGRASMKNPWIYRQIADLLAGRIPYEPTVEDRHDVIRTHFDMVTRQEEPAFAMHKLRTFTGWYTHGLADGKRLRTQISEPTTPRSFSTSSRAFFAEATRAAA